MPDKPLTSNVLNKVLENFHLQHRRAYGFSTWDEPVEFVNLRVTAIGVITKPQLHKLEIVDHLVSDAKTSVRKVFFEEEGGWTQCPIYERSLLPVNGELVGPAIIEENDSTSVIHPGFVVHIDEYGNLIIKSHKESFARGIRSD